jgi:hypothetical protein
MSGSDLMQARYGARRAVASLSSGFVLNDPVSNGTLAEVSGNPHPTADVLLQRIGRIGHGVMLPVRGDEHEAIALGRQRSVDSGDAIHRPHGEFRNRKGAAFTRRTGDPDVGPRGSTNQTCLRSGKGNGALTRRTDDDALVDLRSNDSDDAANGVSARLRFGCPFAGASRR